MFPLFNNSTKKMPMVEILEHADFVIPSLWQRQFVLQGFNGVTCPMKEFIGFCKHLELSESIYNNTHKSNGQTTNVQRNNGLNSIMKTGKSNKQYAGQKRKPTEYYCLFHGSNNTHNTND